MPSTRTPPEAGFDSRAIHRTLTGLRDRLRLQEDELDRLCETIRSRPNGAPPAASPAPRIAALEARGGEVTRVPVYQWEMPEDTGPLREAVRRLSAKEFDAVLFTTSVQADHLMEIAEQEHLVGPMREGLDHAVIASIGPTTTEALNGHGLQPDFEPSHPKMGIMVFELARDFHDLCEKKSRSRL